MAWGAGSAWGAFTGTFPSGSPDPVPPRITDLDPPAGTAIASGQTVAFSITDDVQLSAVVVIASFADGLTEVVHDDFGFRGYYVGAPNARVAVVNGWRYTILRRGGWASTPTIEWMSVDTSGNRGVIA